MKELLPIPENELNKRMPYRLNSHTALIWLLLSYKFALENKRKKRITECDDVLQYLISIGISAQTQNSEKEEPLQTFAEDIKHCNITSMHQREGFKKLIDASSTDCLKKVFKYFCATSTPIAQLILPKIPFAELNGYEILKEILDVGSIGEKVSL